MKFDQLIEYNMRNIFLEKPYINGMVKLFPHPLRITIELISGSVVQGFFIQLLLILCQVECCLKILKLSCRPLAFTAFKAF